MTSVDVFEKPATPRVLDFTVAMQVVHWRDDEGKIHEELFDDRPTTMEGDNLQVVLRGGAREGTLLTGKQVRARRRRQIKRDQRLTAEQWDTHLKPLEEWDPEELARGRPRNINGDFRGRPPKYLNRDLHERAVEMFKTGLKDNLNALTLQAMETVKIILNSEEVDAKGKPVVPAGTQLDAAKFLIEHVLGKAVQPTTSDISVKLQGILGAVMVNPAELGGSELGQMAGYVPAHIGTRGMIEASEGPDGVYYTDDDEDEDDRTDTG